MDRQRSLAEEIQRIRDRLIAMRTEREAAMHRLAESREHAEAQRQGRADALPSKSAETPRVHVSS